LAKSGMSCESCSGAMTRETLASQLSLLAEDVNCGCLFPEGTLRLHRPRLSYWEFEIRQQLQLQFIAQVLFGEFAKFVGNGRRGAQRRRSVSDSVPFKPIADPIDGLVGRPTCHAFFWCRGGVPHLSPHASASRYATQKSPRARWSSRQVFREDRAHRFLGGRLPRRSQPPGRSRGGRGSRWCFRSERRRSHNWSGRREREQPTGREVHIRTVRALDANRSARPFVKAVIFRRRLWRNRPNQSEAARPGASPDC
jgi:hypothetical protein